jgi:glyoxylase-like metal-dependent hydrolase (beta-lactamase superfamily II)
MLADKQESSPGGARLIQRGWLSANSIVLSYGHEPACVIDSGYVSHAAQTVALIENAIGTADLGRIVNTHLHSDHCGGNAALRSRWPAATITTPEGYRSAVMPWDEARLSFRETGQRCARFSVDGFLGDGDELEISGALWQVHAAPGHDPHALMFFEPQSRTLISGDALWERRLAIIFPELQGDSGFDQAYRALETIERLAPHIVLPGHGRAFSDVAAALAQSRQRLERFVRLPQRHREHAVRALVVYHMLEHRRRERNALIAWIASTPIFHAALGITFPGDAGAASAAEGVVESLLDDELLRSEGSNIVVPDNEV